MKSKKLIIAICILMNMATIAMLIIAIIGWKDCYNRMNELEKEIKPQQEQTVRCRDELNLFIQDYFDCKGVIDGDYTYCENGECKNFNEETSCGWYERFYDEFHDEVGAFE